MDTSTSTAEEATNLDPMDEIASLLAGEGHDGDKSDDQEQTPETDTLESDDVEDAPEDSTESDEEEDESDDSDDESYDEDEYKAVLADALKMGADKVVISDDGDVSVKVKVDGVESTHSMDDLIAGYQFKKHNDKKSQALADERKQFEAVAQEQLTKYQQSIERNAQMTDILQKEFMAEYESTDWDDLKQYDPAAYAAKQIDFSKRYSQLKNLGNAVGGQKAELDEEAQAARTKAHNEYLQGQHHQMMDKNPTWTDPEVFKTEMGGLRGFLSDTYGFTAQNLDAVEDARLIELAKDAMSYKKGSKVAEKKVKKVPNIRKSKGVRKQPKVSKLDKLTKAAKRAKGANKRDLENDAVASLLLGG